MTSQAVRKWLILGIGSPVGSHHGKGRILCTRKTVWSVSLEHYAVHRQDSGFYSSLKKSRVVSNKKKCRKIVIFRLFRLITTTVMNQMPWNLIFALKNISNSILQLWNMPSDSSLLQAVYLKRYLFPQIHYFSYLWDPRLKPIWPQLFS